MHKFVWISCFTLMSMSMGCDKDPEVTDDTSSDDTGTAASGTFVLPSDEDGDGTVDVITDPEGFGREILPITDFDEAFGQAYLVEVEDEENLLVAWGDLTEAFLPGTATQGAGATSRCTGTVSTTSFSTTCDKLWTDMTTTVKGRFPADDVVGCNVLEASFEGELDADSGQMSNAKVSGLLDLETIESESVTGGDYLSLCEDYYAATGTYCTDCPDDGTAACVPFTMVFSSGTRDETLDLVE